MEEIDKEPVGIREVCSRVNRLNEKVKTLQDTVDFLEAEVLALGNILVRRELLTLKELENCTAVVIRQRLARQEAERRGPIHALREEFEEALQERIRQ